MRWKPTLRPLAPPPLPSLLLLIALLPAIAGPLRGDEHLPARVDYNFDIKPILSDRCYTCHGPDAGQREADLRLDLPLAGHEASSGLKIIDRDIPAQSELLRRIEAMDEDQRMPPSDSKLELSKREIKLLRRWIEQGAAFQDHWSLLPIRSSKPPLLRDSDWPRESLDPFILVRLQQQGLEPAPEADRATWLRRVTFDLTGLPPTIEQLDAFLADRSDNAYEDVVDRLLQSPRFGERMAVDWLDAARYADTYGYQSDVYRDTWPWRDWVVEAFNDNLPYDQFLTWQLAGDLLPNATVKQQLATAFNRHHRQTNEGGSIEEEFRAEYVADRVNTLGAAVLGLTLECCRCHDHKYDPLQQKEYYQLAAFFNNIDESGLYSHFTNAVPTPTLLLTSPAEQQAADALRAEIRAAEQAREALAVRARAAEAREQAFQQWRQRIAQQETVTLPRLVGHFPFESLDKNQVANLATDGKPGSASDDPAIVDGKVGKAIALSGENNVTFESGGSWTRQDAFSLAFWLKTPDLKQRAVLLHRSRAWTDAGSRGYQLLLEEGRLSGSLIHFWPGNAIRVRTREVLPIDRWVHVAMTYDGSSRAEGLQLFVDGQVVATDVVRDNLYKEITGGGVDRLTLGQRFRDRGFKGGQVDELYVFARQLAQLEVAHLYDGQALATTAKQAELSAKELDALFACYVLSEDAQVAEADVKLRDLRQRLAKLRGGIREVMVMREMKERRPTYLLRRGAYDAPGEQVSAGVPASLPPLKGESLNRLDLARWLTSPQHPLTARVAVNRFWQALFGQGLVATPEDFGSQGQLPTHPKLLDHLARDFIDSGWDVKRFFKRAVLSATYRQSSLASAQLQTLDPDNSLLGRAPTYRLPAEMIRDQALASAGLLIEKRGGPPVKPYQPAGLWKEKSGQTYQRDKGEGSHRRSLYTYWKRTSPPPAMMTLDAAKRDVCVVKRQTTATPLQALLLLNDPQYVEASRGLAERAQQHAANTPDQLAFLFRLLTSHTPNARQQQLLQRVYEEQRADFHRHPDGATRLLAVGDHPLQGQPEPISLAALSVVAQMLLNYDGTVTKR